MPPAAPRACWAVAATAIAACHAARPSETSLPLALPLDGVTTAAFFGEARFTMTADPPPPPGLDAATRGVSLFYELEAGASPMTHRVIAALDLRDLRADLAAAPDGLARAAALAALRTPGVAPVWARFTLAADGATRFDEIALALDEPLPVTQPLLEALLPAPFVPLPIPAPTSPGARWTSPGGTWSVAAADPAGLDLDLAAERVWREETPPGPGAAREDSENHLRVTGRWRRDAGPGLARRVRATWVQTVSGRLHRSAATTPLTAEVRLDVTLERDDAFHN
jgi:hypothetical protein